MKTSVTHEPELQRFVLQVNGTAAGHLDYVLDHSGVADFRHTVVAEEFRGKGLSGPLSSGALEYAREEGWRVRPTCPAVAGFVDKHPEFSALLA